jgi:hypothetical protein
MEFGAIILVLFSGDAIRLAAAKIAALKALFGKTRAPLANFRTEVVIIQITRLGDSRHTRMRHNAAPHEQGYR